MECKHEENQIAKFVMNKLVTGATAGETCAICMTATIVRLEKDVEELKKTLALTQKELYDSRQYDGDCQ